MNLLYPHALWALASVAFLVLLSLWRQQPRRVVVSSVRVWESVPDRAPPIRALNRPRLSVLLLLQALAVAALVGAMAGPGILHRRTAPRRLAVVWDLSASMAPRLKAARSELRKLDPVDQIILYTTPSLERYEGLAIIEGLKAEDRSGDPRIALDLAAAEAPTVIWLSDRRTSWTAPEGVRLLEVLVGGPIRNVGITDAHVASDHLFLRLSEPAEVEVNVDGRSVTLPEAATHLVEVSESATKIVAALAPDEYPADDRVVLERDAEHIDVAMEGRADDAVRQALEAHPRTRWIHQGRPDVLVSVGAAPASPATITVLVDAADADVARWFAPRHISVADDVLMRGVRAEEVVLLETGELRGAWERTLLFADGVPVAGVRRGGKEIVLATRFGSSGWPRHPSFPIFWKNVVDLAGSSGAWRASGLLDSAASRLGTERRPLEASSWGEPPREVAREDITPSLVVAACALIGLAWLLDARAA
ncbi:MAG: BatA domain-containing protein [Planctomycetes bacterium]|nr:BatA domain-containing protein [Planctomycetota bacterium]